MPQLLKLSAIILGTVALVLIATPGALFAANQIILECPVEKPVVDGDSIALRVFVVNDEGIGGFSLGFSYDSDDIEFSSAAPGPALQTGGFGNFLVTPDPANNRVLIGWINFTPAIPMPIHSTPTHFFTLWFSVPPGTPAQCVNIDSTFVPPAGYFILAPQAGGTIYPEYFDCGLEDINIAGGCDVIVNTPPVVSDIPNQTIPEGGAFTPISLDNYVTDAEDDVADIVWTAVSSNPNGIVVSIDANRVATITHPGGQFSGSAVYVFTAMDTGGLTDSDSATFTVTPVNDPPVVADIPNQTVPYGGTFTSINLDSYVSDPDNADNEIVWTYSGNVDLVVDIDASRVATITKPSPDWYGSETITFTATDPDGLQDSDDATFTVDSPAAVIVLNTDSLFFNTYENGGNPAAQVVIITNGGTGDLDWDASEDIPWLSLSAYSGTAPSGFNVNIDITGLDIGVYEGAITVTSAQATNSPRIIFVRLTIVDDVEILLTPDALLFSTEIGVNPASQSFTITNASPSGIEFNWGAIETTPWLSLSMTSGTTPSTVDVFIDVAGLNIGTYEAKVIIKQAEMPAGVDLAEDTLNVTLVVDQTTGVEDIGGVLPSGFSLSQNYPNPFNPTTNVEFNLPKAEYVRLTVYNVLGQRVKELVNESLPAGNKRVAWDGTDTSGRTVESGVYFYRLQAGDFNQTRKMMLLK